MNLLPQSGGSRRTAHDLMPCTGLGPVRCPKWQPQWVLLRLLRSGPKRTVPDWLLLVLAPERLLYFLWNNLQLMCFINQTTKKYRGFVKCWALQEGPSCFWNGGSLDSEFPGDSQIVSSSVWHLDDEVCMQ